MKSLLLLVLQIGCFAEIGRSSSDFACQDRCELTVLVEAIDGTVTSSDGISVTGRDIANTCSIEGAPRTLCELSAAEGDAIEFVADSARFARWTVGCAGLDPRCVLTITQPTRVAAAFCAPPCE